MKYYRVLPLYDQRLKNPKSRDGDIYIANELYTTREIEKQRLNVACMELVDIPKIYWFFGARFAVDKEGQK